MSAEDASIPPADEGAPAPAEPVVDAGPEAAPTEEAPSTEVEATPAAEEAPPAEAEATPPAEAEATTAEEAPRAEGAGADTEAEPATPAPDADGAKEEAPQLSETALEAQSTTDGDATAVGAESTPVTEEAKEALPSSPPSPPAVTQKAPKVQEPIKAPPSMMETTSVGVDIKFIVLPEGFVYLDRVTPTISMVDVYNRLSNTFRCDRRNMKILYRGNLLMDEDVLGEKIDIVVDGHIMLNVELDYMPRHLQLLQKYEVLDTVVQVQINYGEGIPPKMVTVAVVKGFQHKQYMGGFRHKKTESEYHHAVAQTDPKKKEPKPKPPCYSRVTQTAGITRSQQTKREAWTQMARPGLEIDISADQLYHPKQYFSAKDLHGLRILKCIVLQAHVRGWKARRLARSMRDEEDRIKAEQRKEEERRRKIHEQKRQREIERRTHPRTPADFAILYNELEAWRLQESKKIKESNMDDSEKALARQELLKKETRLLQTIDKLQIKANAENKKEKTKAELSAMAAHKTWYNSNPELGHTIVETPFTVRAKELLDLYNGLQLKVLSVDERLDILLHVKWSVKEFECPLTREIVELIDREADLLNRGRKDKSLEGLRKRMSNLFLQFCETPEFNPEAINHQRVPLEFTSRPLVKLDATTKR
uniref:IQ motif and ubiquitin-like domain-containing protein n=1 Tax=Eutreptiella gymnastica TaxID=73025 RepID=A0A7S1J067_9EUGL|mmetsp:Transcript_56173/g.99990  ORF Transcript_56173/g.99990 Transcript_56173/m.99990 type:complete len:649 (+) Transcript_56173:108-2054(+)